MLAASRATSQRSTSPSGRTAAPRSTTMLHAPGACSSTLQHLLGQVRRDDDAEVDHSGARYVRDRKVNRPKAHAARRRRAASTFDLRVAPYNRMINRMMIRSRVPRPMYIPSPPYGRLPYPGMRRENGRLGASVSACSAAQARTVGPGRPVALEHDDDLPAHAAAAPERPGGLEAHYPAPLAPDALRGLEAARSGCETARSRPGACDRRSSASCRGFRRWTPGSRPSASCCSGSARLLPLYRPPLTGSAASARAGTTTAAQSASSAMPHLKVRATALNPRELRRRRRRSAA